MHLRINHTTSLRYDGPVAASYNEARMTPSTGHEQYVLHSRLDVAPSPWTYTYTDYFGTPVTAFEVHERHEELVVTSTSTVDVVRYVQRPGEVGWDDLADPDVYESYAEMLDVSHWVRPGDELAGWVEERRGAGVAPGALAREVCERVHAEIRYVPGSTEVHTTAAEAWEAREGVCQDISHLTIGALRSAGIPARYVSGYLHPHRDPQVGETVTGESHAWVEWWDGDWIGYDPTNAVVPGDRHVMIGHGRDYGDVAPLRGIFAGSTADDMSVEVQVTRLKDPQR